MKTLLQGAELRVMLWIFFIVSFLWDLEIRRLIGAAQRQGFDVRFVDAIPGDALGVNAGMTVHRDKLIYIKTGPTMTRAKLAAVLRHELEHVDGALFAWAPKWLRCGGTWGTLAGLVSLSFETVAGSTLHCTVTVPSSYDLTGYSDTDIVWTAIGEITDLGSGYGRQYNVVSHAPISSAQVTQKKGGYTLPPVDITMAWDQSDSGQDLCRAASLDNSILTMKLTKQGGDKRYFTAQVSRFVENFGTVDNVVVGMLTLLPQRNYVSDPA